MYKLSIFNGSTETIIHYPTADSNAPHVGEIQLKDGLSLIDNITFNLYPTNCGFDKVQKLTTYVKVYDVRDNSIRFAGRVQKVSNIMESSGAFHKEVLCYGALGFLRDTNQRNKTFACASLTEFLTQILAVHNSQVDSPRQIQVGNVNVTGSVAYTCEFINTFETLTAVKNSIGGDFRVRESNGVLYLDWLESFSEETVDVTLGKNMQDMIKDEDTTSFGTRIIPLGANNLTIGTPDYIDDESVKAVYGVIEQKVQYSDITDATALKNACLADLSNYTQPKYSLECNAIDLSYLPDFNVNRFKLGTNLHIINSVMAIDDTYDVIKIEVDLLKPYNPKLTISNEPVTIISKIVELSTTTIKNNGVYNNVQIGSAYGIRAVRSDGKVTTTINATDGISIENESQKVFSVDENGNIVANNITSNNMIANYGTYNNIRAEGGTFNDIKANNVTAKNGTYTDVTVEGEFRTGNSGEERTVIDGNGIQSFDANNNMAGMVCNQPSVDNNERFADLLLYWLGQVAFEIYNEAEGSITLKSYGNSFLTSRGSSTTMQHTWNYGGYEVANTKNVDDLQNYFQPQIDDLVRRVKLIENGI